MSRNSSGTPWEPQVNSGYETPPPLPELSFGQPDYEDLFAKTDWELNIHQVGSDDGPLLVPELEF